VLKVALDLHVAALLPFARCDGCLYYIYYKVGRRPKKVANKVEKLREAKASAIRALMRDGREGHSGRGEGRR
jgi:hypothetical protein